MTQNITANKFIIILFVFIFPTASYAEIYSNTLFLAEINAELNSKKKSKKTEAQTQSDEGKKNTKSDKSAKESKTAKSSQTAKTRKSHKLSKAVKPVHSDSQRTIKSYVAYTKAGNHVSTRCFPKRLTNILRKVQSRYGVKPVINSGFRSSKQNRRVGGARNSYHVKCMAADIKVPGVSKYKLARYLRSISGVGGVGTYACKSFIHVDVGPKRSWHWRCRGKRRTRA